MNNNIRQCEPTNPVSLLPLNMQEVGHEASDGCCSGTPSETDIVIMWLLLELADHIESEPEGLLV
jgi:hypothetical protein